jgi:hypothetical protein
MAMATSMRIWAVQRARGLLALRAPGLGFGFRLRRGRLGGRLLGVLLLGLDGFRGRASGFGGLWGQ